MPAVFGVRSSIDIRSYGLRSQLSRRSAPSIEFTALFVIVTVVGVAAARWRRGDRMNEALAVAALS